ncbi:cytochrome P450 [Amylostereum chailletii]|nr:cytochrome P450 [Amylostereum chailletii]
MNFLIVICGICASLFFVLRPFLFVPLDLRHLPRVPILPLLWSYLSGEVEDKRLKRLVLPFANEKNEGIVLVWALGRWMVHILDRKLGSAIFADIDQFPKENPPDDLLLWQFIGRSNILLSNGEQWRKHSHIIRSAINQTIPVAQFVALARRLFAFMDSRATIPRFDDMSQKYALDAVGTTVFGHDFNAIAEESDFVRNYNNIMHGIANPLYVILPVLERIFPRHALKRGMDSLAEAFQGVLTEKRENPGADMLTYMLRNVDVTERELRDNMLLLFIAGHDTSSGGISTLIYYLAKHPDLQARARKEVLDVLGDDTDPTLETVQKMHYLVACVREALRVNTPISYVVPRATSSSVTLGRHTIPPNTSIILNIYAIHHNSTGSRRD